MRPNDCVSGNRRHRTISILSAILAATLRILSPAVSAAAAQPGAEVVPPAQKQAHHFYITVEGFFPTADTDLEARIADASLLTVSAAIDLEEQLGLPQRSDLLRLRAGYGWGRRHAVELSYLQWNRSGQAGFREEIGLADLPSIPFFPGLLDLPDLPDLFDLDLIVDVALDSALRIEEVEASYRYSFFVAARGEVGLSAGVHTILSDGELTASAAAITPVGRLELLEATRVQTDVSAPFAVLGLYGAYRPAQKWRIGGSLKFFGLELDEYTGSYRDVEAYVEHQAIEQLAFGVGFSANLLDVSDDLENENLISRLRWERNGVSAYVRLRFGR